MRLDIYLFENGLFPSREQAKFNIKKGNVTVNAKKVFKASYAVNQEDVIETICSNAIPYVSRGGLKLEKALKEFNIACNNIEALDVGASTGGFTDCLLKHGAKLVYAIDVGTNQLASSLKTNPKVISIEKINIKELKPEHVDSKNFNLIVADLSFISVTKVLEYFKKFIAENGKVIILIKPQFEVGQQNLGKDGVAKQPKSHVSAIENIAQAAKDIELSLTKLTWSPIHYRDKNIEYLALLEKGDEVAEISDIVEKAFVASKEIN